MAERGTAAGFATVFPDARNEMWDDVGLGRTDGIDDAAFIAALVARLTVPSLRNGSPGKGAGANGCSPVPTVETLAAHHADLSTDRLSWTGQGCRPVILYKIAGGGHGWPGGPQCMPAVLVRPIARSLNAGLA
jgi:poly(3-hydroxybutyrate) depolymerase